MIRIKCKKCGWRLPFSSKRNEDTVKNRGDSSIICPSCGEILIKKGGKGYEWKSTIHN
jgi:ribosomal protein S27E